MGTRQSSAAYRELGQMLRQVREGAGLTAEALSHNLGFSLTTVSRMENGLRTSSTTDVIQYVVMCGLKEREFLPIVEFTRLAERKQGYYLSDARIGGSLQSLIFHESTANRSITYQPQVIHGLLQTPEYAQAIVTAISPDHAEQRVSGVVRTRMERQRILSLPNPGCFTFYLHEHALRLRVGSDQVMHEQLLHIVLTAALDNVTVRVVPSAAGERSVFGGAFSLMDFRQYRPMVYLDNLRVGGLILEESGRVRSYRDLMPMLADVALEEGDSLEFMAELADLYDRKRQQDAPPPAQPRRRANNPLVGVVAKPRTPIYE
jgi:transcriptional regulator with XRE-family HTH domain